MAVPSNPTYLEVIRNGMIEAGQYNLATTSTAVSNFASRQFQTIKTRLWDANEYDDLLESKTIATVSVGSRTLLLPSDFDHELRVRIFDGDDSLRGTAQTGYASAVTLASNFSFDATGILGSYLFLMSGTGNGQQGQIIEYDNTTKIATVSAAWTTQPDSTTAYLVSNFYMDLPRLELRQGYMTNTRPTRYRLRGRTMELEPAPDKTYPIELWYGANLTRLDEEGTVFVRHLRERWHYWHELIKLYTMALYDDDRADGMDMKIERVLLKYAGKNAVVDQMLGSR